MKTKKFLAVVAASVLCMSMASCGDSSSGSDSKSGDSSKSGSGKTIKVGIINNDPNESGYRTANDKDLKATFTKENGYDADFKYSLKNEEQITYAQKFIQDGTAFSTMLRRPA